MSLLNRNDKIEKIKRIFNQKKEEKALEEQENTNKIKNDYSNDNEILEIVEEFVEKVDPDNNK